MRTSYRCGVAGRWVLEWRYDQLLPETFLPVQIDTPASPLESIEPSVVVIASGAIRVRFEGPADLEVLRTVLASLRATS